MIQIAKCPKCGKDNEQVGNVTGMEFRGNEPVTNPVFECSECVVERELFGERFEQNLMYRVDMNGESVRFSEIPVE